MILLIGADQPTEDSVRAALSDIPHTRVLALHRSGPAMARLSGGDISLVVIHYSFLFENGTFNHSMMARLLGAAGGKPIVLLGGPQQQIEALASKTEGVTALDLSSDGKVRLRRMVESIPPTVSAEGYLSDHAASKGLVIAFSGAKGGSGVTTVAANIAAALSRRGKVILAEILPSPGSLAAYFRLPASVPTLGHLLDASPRQLRAEATKKLLWSSRDSPNLQFLFASQNLSSIEEIRPEVITALVLQLARLADFVILDLPHTLNANSRVAIHASDVFSIVVERDALALEAAKTKLQVLQNARILPQQIGAIVVNKAPLGAPLPIAEFEARLGIALFGSVPPAPDLCAAANKARKTVGVFDAESSIARSLSALALAVTGNTSQAFSLPTVS